MEKHYMIDIETTGTDKLNDSILEIAVIELEYKYPYWHQTGKEFHEILHYSGEPETVFAKEHMSELYKKCNNAPLENNYKNVSRELKVFLNDYADEDLGPKFFMGWNASNFDIPFMFAKNILTPSFYEKVSEDKEELRGDVHYRIYEQTGSLNVISNLTGLTRKTIKQLALDLNPTDVKLPKGKSHDALYDCYWQLIMMNGLIEIGRKGIKK